MRKLLLMLMLLPVVLSCSKSKNEAPASEYGSWTVNGATRIADTSYKIINMIMVGVQDNKHSINIHFSGAVPVNDRTDSINNPLVHSNGLYIQVTENGITYTSEETAVLLTSAKEQGEMTYSFPEISLSHPQHGTIKASGAIKYEP